MRLTVEVEQVAVGNRIVFTFRHEGDIAYCFVVADPATLPRLAPKMRVGMIGRWSPTVRQVFEGWSFTVLDHPPAP